MPVHTRSVNRPPKAVVLVDDEKAYIDVLADLMKEHLGWPVVTFTRPEEALAALPALEVGVIVTDYYMPRMDGFEFIRQSSRLLPEVPFILISGHTIHLPEDRLGGLKALRSILPKPFGWRRLVDEIVRQVPAYAEALARVPGETSGA